MRYSIKSTEGGCTLTVANHHTTSDFPVPMMAGDLTALLSTLLADPDKREVESGSVLIVRTPASVTIRTSAGGFDIPWSHLFVIQGAPNA